MNQSLNPQKTPQMSPYGVSFVTILEKINRIITVLHCTVNWILRNNLQQNLNRNTKLSAKKMIKHLQILSPNCRCWPYQDPTHDKSVLVTQVMAGFEISNWMHLSVRQVDRKNHLSECTIHLSEIYKAMMQLMWNSEIRSRPSDESCRYSTCLTVIFTCLRWSEEWHFEPWMVWHF